MRNTKLLFAAVAALAAAPAFAQVSDDDTMDVTANVNAACSINAPVSMSITAANYTGGTDATGTLDVWCTNGTNATVTASSANKLTSTTTTFEIPYTVSIPSPNVVGNSDGSDDSVGFSLDFAGGLYPEAGSYTDTVTFTVSG